MDDFNTIYPPLQHPNQNRALDNHVMIMYYDKDVNEVNREGRYKVCKWFFYILVVIFIIIGINSMVSKNYLSGIILIIISIACIFVAYKLNKQEKSIDSSIGFSYYSYDITDNYLKYIIVKDRNDIINGDKIMENLGDFSDIYKITRFFKKGERYLEKEPRLTGEEKRDGPDYEIIVAIEKQNSLYMSKSLKSENHDYIGGRLTVFPNLRSDLFANVMTQRINAIKSIHNIQQQY